MRESTGEEWEEGEERRGQERERKGQPLTFEASRTELSSYSGGSLRYAGRPLTALRPDQESKDKDGLTNSKVDKGQRNVQAEKAR